MCRAPYTAALYIENVSFNHHALWVGLGIGVCAAPHTHTCHSSAACPITDCTHTDSRSRHGSGCISFVYMHRFYRRTCSNGLQRFAGRHATLPMSNQATARHSSCMQKIREAYQAAYVLSQLGRPSTMTLTHRLSVECHSSLTI